MTEEAQVATRAQYKGDGNEHINGVPLRDLSEEEWQHLDAETREAVRRTRRGDGKPLYDVSTDREMAGRATRSGKDAPAAPEPAVAPAEEPPATPAEGGGE